jgi:hypothetical protein
MEKKKLRTYTPEFKFEAVKLWESSGRNSQQVGSRLLAAGADLVFSNMNDLPDLLRSIEKNGPYKQQA